MWLLEAEEIDEEQLRAIVRVAIEEGLFALWRLDAQSVSGAFGRVVPVVQRFRVGLQFSQLFGC